MSRRARWVLGGALSFVAVSYYAGVLFAAEFVIWYVVRL